MEKLIQEEILPQIIKTRNAGQKEYAHNTENVFANFERVAEATDSTKEKVLMVYLLRKSLVNLIQWI